MANRDGNGVVWKTLIIAAGLILTIALTLLASGGSWGQTKEKVSQLEIKTVAHDICIEGLKAEDKVLTTENQRTREDVVGIKKDLQYIKEAVDDLRRRP